MRYLFLDMDGVLNSHHHCLFVQRGTAPRGADAAEQGERTLFEAELTRMLWDVDPRLAFNLRFVCERVPDLRIVISSTWRKVFQRDRFEELFRRLGFPEVEGGLVVGETPTIVAGQRFSERMPRIAQIEAWRRENGLPPWKDCLIVDDHHVAGGELYYRPDPGGPKPEYLPEDDAWQERFLQTDQLDGFTYCNAVRAVTLLLGTSNWGMPSIMM